MCGPSNLKGTVRLFTINNDIHDIEVFVNCQSVMCDLSVADLTAYSYS